VNVNLLADFGDAGGWGRHARCFGGALARHARVVPLWRHRPAQGFRLPDDDAPLPRLGRWDDSAPGIGIGSAGRPPVPPGALRIAFTVWETSRVPAAVMRRLHEFDQVWVPTAWGRDILVRAGFELARLRVVQEGVDAARFRPSPLPEPRDLFRFLCVAKWEERKGTADLVRTFCREFGPSEPVELLMHCHNVYLPDTDVRTLVSREIRRATGRDHHPRVSVASDRLPLEGLIRLMQGCDAFVVTTRAEGWGLPILEAMACGLPCIVTDHGGHRTFADGTNGYLIAVERMVPVRDPLFFEPRVDWGEWAQPDLDHLAHLMRHVYEHRDEAREKGRTGRRQAVERWSWANAAGIAMGHLRALVGEESA
jgi:glycosyltransferase involved in cell wall biosynthesis